jgi:tetratricopeptide (TPR) repeat protein
LALVWVSCKDPTPPPVAGTNAELSRPTAPPPTHSFSAGSATNLDFIQHTFQQALLAEETERRLDTAIEHYRQVIGRLDEHRDLAASAIYRLGECYRKQGRTNEAIAQYQRILTDFSEQETLAQLSRQNLMAWAVGREAGTNTRGNLAKQLELLRQEISLVKDQVEVERRMIQAGRLDQEKQLATQRDLLALQRLQTVLESGHSPAAEAEAWVSPDTAAKQRELFQKELLLIQDQLTIQKKRIEVGVVESSSAIPLERERLALQRQLAALEEPPAGRPGPSPAAEVGASQPATYPATPVLDDEAK